MLRTPLFSLLLLLQLSLLCSVHLVRAGMTFYAVAVGQGDSCIIQCPNGKDLLLLDMGASPPRFAHQDYLTKLLKEKFHAADSGMSIHILVSHSHTDHYDYLQMALDAELVANVRGVILGGNYTNYKQSFRSWLEGNFGDHIYTINNQLKCFGNANCTLTSRNGDLAKIQMNSSARKTGDPWQFCPRDSGVKFTVLGANIGSTENGQSVILKIQYKSWSMLMSGDFEMVSPQQELINNWPNSTLKSNYYKAAHHGAWTSRKPNIPDLLQRIQPRRVYISHGYPSLSKFHHPNSGTINNLKDIGSIVSISPSTNAPFVYWDDDAQKVVTLKSGMNLAIYETCRYINTKTQMQTCQDIVIKTNGKTDTTKYVDVPTQYH